MTCDTLVRIDPDGRKIYKSKKPYNALEDAIKEAKKLNAQDHQIHKLVAYKCNYCRNYHIGRNGKEISEKDRFKYKKESLNLIKFKVVGKINL